MVYYNNLKNFFLYKDKEFLLDPVGKEKRRGSLVFLNSLDLSDSVSTLRSPLMDKKYFQSYYLDRDQSIKGSGINKKVIIKPRDYYKKIKEKTNCIVKTYSSINQYNGLNLFYELGLLNYEFFKNTTLDSKKKAKLYITLLKNKLESEGLESYKKKYIYFPINDYVEDVDTMYYSLDLLKTPINIIYYLLIKDEEYLLKNFKGYEFVFMSSKCNFFFKMKIDEESLKSFNKSRFQMFINVINKLNNGDYANLTDQEKLLVTDAEEDINEDLEKNNSSKETLINATLKTATGKKVEYKNFTGDQIDVVDKMETVIDKIPDVENKSASEVLDELNSDEEFTKLISNFNDSAKSVRTPAQLKRISLIQDEHKKLKIGDLTVEQILDNFGSEKLDLHKINIESKNIDKIGESALSDFEKNYNEKQDLKDKIAILNSFANKDNTIPLYIRDFKRSDVSDSFSKKELWEIDFEDERGKRHHMSFEVPLFLDDKFLFMNNNKKTILKQLCPKPIMKTAPDTVQCVSNYNKVFLYRFGQKVSPEVDLFKKFASLINDGKYITVKYGNSSEYNEKFLTSIEYDELAKNYITIKVKNKALFSFNQIEFREKIEKSFPKMKFKDDEFPFGMKGTKTVYVFNQTTNKIIIHTEGKKETVDKSLIQFMLDEITSINPELADQLNDLSVSKRYVYTRASVLSKKIPLVLFLSFGLGLSGLLKRANINYEFHDKRKRLSNADKMKTGVIQFQDGFLHYDLYPYRNSLLMNGLVEIDTKNISFSDLDKEETYYEIFNNLYGTRTIAKGFHNVIELFVDPITLSVLQKLNLPENFYDIFIYANSLLEDNKFIPENNMSNYRIRSNEIINVYIYKTLVSAYERYKNSANSSSPIKMSVPKNQVLKEVIMSPLVEDYSTLNPIKEMESIGSITYKGPSGLNLDAAFTIDKRSYDESMMGILGMSSPYNAKVGINRQLSYNPNIIDTRGIIKPGSKTSNDLNYGNLGTVAELAVPFTLNHDDSPRTAMASGQSEHLIPVEKSDKLLIGNGIEKAMPQVLTNDFIFRSKEDGKVLDYDEDAGLIVLEYKSGKRDFINVNSNIAKNGGGGFYISNTLKTDLKIGSKFKKDEILAKNEQYFSGEKEDTQYVIGHLSKVAVHFGYYTFEDSSICTEKFSKNMTSFITMKKAVKNIGPNSNVDYMAKVGQEVKTGDPILVFEHSYDEKEANELLAKLGDEQQQMISDFSKNKITSKYTGVIEDIKIYYNCDEEELSPSLKKIVKQYRSKVNKKKKFIDKYKNDEGEATSIILPPTEKIESTYGKIKGEDIGSGLLIEFYIKYRDQLGVGDKIALYAAAKSIIAEKIPDELAPYSEFRPDEPIDQIFGMISISARMTMSLWKALYGNKVIVELKRKCQEIFEG